LFDHHYPDYVYNFFRLILHPNPLKPTAGRDDRRDFTEVSVKQVPDADGDSAFEVEAGRKKSKERRVAWHATRVKKMGR
jgi:hypothetical protein